MKKYYQKPKTNELQFFLTLFLKTHLFQSEEGYKDRREEGTHFCPVKPI